MAWYQDVFRGLGLVGTGVVTGYGTGGGNLGGLFGGVYGAVKASTGGASKGGDAYARNVYQTAIPSAAAGLLLYPSNRSAQQTIAGLGPSYQPSGSDAVSFQIAALKGELAGGASAVGSGATSAGRFLWDETGNVGGFIGKTISGTGKGIGDFLAKGGLSNGLPMWLAGLSKAQLPNLAFGSNPAFVAPVSTSPGAGPQAAPSIVPIPANSTAPEPQLAGMPWWAMLALVGAALAFVFRKKLA